MDGEVLIRRSIEGNLDSLEDIGYVLAKDMVKEMNKA